MVRSSGVRPTSPGCYTYCLLTLLPISLQGNRDHQRGHKNIPSMGYSEDQRRCVCCMIFHSSFFFLIVNNILFSHICLQLKLWQFKIYILAHELLINTRKLLNLGFHTVVLCFTSCLPSGFMRIFLPTISLGKTKSSRMESCTATSVQLLGSFCLFFL